MNVLETVQSACLRCNVPAPSVAVLSTDPLIQQMVELLHEEGNELASRYPWQALGLFAAWTADGTGTEGDLDTLAPGISDVVNDTFWNLTQRRPLFGPVDPSAWAQMMAQQWAGPWSHYRIVGNTLYTYPYASSGHSLKFEYRTKYWLEHNSVRVEFAQDDTDSIVLDSNLMVLGLVWRWKQATGLEYAEDFQKYERRCADKMARDGTKPILSMSGNPDGIQPGIIVPTGNWNVS